MQKDSILLLVDDRPENLLALESILNEDHRKFLTATSGSEALLMTDLENIDLILLDYHLGELNGIEVARQLRKRPSTAHIPIILVTAISKRESLTLEEFEAGTIDVLRKPLDFEETRAKVSLYEEMSLFRKQCLGKKNP
ncbi:MAG: response regulator [Bacteroidetes bacterium]|nr:response regulator [Bacteroidota bacterium]